MLHFIHRYILLWYVILNVSLELHTNASEVVHADLQLLAL